MGLRTSTLFNATVSDFFLVFFIVTSTLQLGCVSNSDEERRICFKDGHLPALKLIVIDIYTII